jgi:hypothetical protein
MSNVGTNSSLRPQILSTRVLLGAVHFNDLMLWAVWDFATGVAKQWVLPGYDAVSVASGISPFRQNVLPLYSRTYRLLKTRPLRSLETSGCDNPLPQRRMPAKPNPWPYVPADTKLLYIQTYVNYSAYSIVIHPPRQHMFEIHIADHNDNYGVSSTIRCKNRHFGKAMSRAIRPSRKAPIIWDWRN